MPLDRSTSPRLSLTRSQIRWPVVMAARTRPRILPSAAASTRAHCAEVSGLGLAQIPWPHFNSYAQPRCDPKAARLNTRQQVVELFRAPARITSPRVLWANEKRTSFSRTVGQPGPILPHRLALRRQDGGLARPCVGDHATEATCLRRFETV